MILTEPCTTQRAVLQFPSSCFTARHGKTSGLGTQCIKTRERSVFFLIFVQLIIQLLVFLFAIREFLLESLDRLCGIRWIQIVIRLYLGT